MDDCDGPTSQVAELRRDGRICVISLADFADGRQVYMVANEGSIVAAEQITKLLQLKTIRYNVVTSNCEHVSSLCTQGPFRSRQVDACIRRLETFLTAWHTDSQLSGVPVVSDEEHERIKDGACPQARGRAGWGGRGQNAYRVDSDCAQEQDNGTVDAASRFRGERNDRGSKPHGPDTQGPFLHPRGHWSDQVPRCALTHSPLPCLPMFAYLLVLSTHLLSGIAPEPFAFAGQGIDMVMGVVDTCITAVKQHIDEASMRAHASLQARVDEQQRLQTSAEDRGGGLEGEWVLVDELGSTDVVVDPRSPVVRVGV